MDAIRWQGETLALLDQTRLPTEEVWDDYTDYRRVAEAIRRLVVRGAPAIGIAAAYAEAKGHLGNGKNHGSVREVHRLSNDGIAVDEGFQVLHGTVCKVAQLVCCHGTHHPLSFVKVDPWGSLIYFQQGKGSPPLFFFFGFLSVFSGSLIGPEALGAAAAGFSGPVSPLLPAAPPA